MSSAVPGPAKTVVVAAASRHGSTREIADRIAQRLSQGLPRWRVDRAEPSDVAAFDQADAVVLGSAIYYGRWLRPAVRALEHVRALPPSDLWLFSTGPVSDEETENEQAISADALADIAEGDEHMVFGGRLDASRLSRVERLVVKVVRAHPGDHRDWAAVDAWADRIAAELGTRSGPPEGTKDSGGQGIGL